MSVAGLVSWLVALAIVRWQHAHAHFTSDDAKGVQKFHACQALRDPSTHGGEMVRTFLNPNRSCSRRYLRRHEVSNLRVLQKGRESIEGSSKTTLRQFKAYEPGFSTTSMSNTCRKCLMKSSATTSLARSISAVVKSASCIGADNSDTLARGDNRGNEVRRNHERYAEGVRNSCCRTDRNGCCAVASMTHASASTSAR